MNHARSCTVIVMVSSFKGKDRESISENVTKLGGSLREGPVFDCSVSHVVWKHVWSKFIKSAEVLF